MMRKAVEDAKKMYVTDESWQAACDQILWDFAGPVPRTPTPASENPEAARVAEEGVTSWTWFGRDITDTRTRLRIFP